MPERRLIAALLEYASLGKQGDFQQISSETRIPMGKSNGKVPAIIDYSQGMGLITLANKKGHGIKKPLLTDFGKIVFLEDKYMGEELVQWLTHMNLCRSDIGAKAWNSVFAVGRSVLGSTFTKIQLEEYLVSIYGHGKERTGPLLNTYIDDAALARAGVLVVDGEKVIRKKAPIIDIFAISYSAYILSLMESYFPGQGQVTVTDFNLKTLWFDICLWNETDIEYLFSLVERKNLITIDRQMKPWVIEKKYESHEVWSHIFDDMP